jgi:hypothetical protein
MKHGACLPDLDVFVCFLDATLISQSLGLSASVEGLHLWLGLGAELLCGFGTLVHEEVK